jgi:5'-nucleotidase
VHELAPFGNAMVTMKLDGATLRRILERAVGGEWVPYTPEQAHEMSRRLGGKRLVRGLNPGRKKTGFLLMHGLSYRFDAGRPEGSRIASIDVGAKPLDDTRLYTIVCSNYLAAGGDGFPEFKDGRDVEVHPLIDREVITRYLGRHRPLTDQPPRTVWNLANQIEPPTVAGP